MRRFILTFALLALLAPFAAADTAPAEEAAPAMTAAEAPATETAPVEAELDLEALLSQVDPTADAQAKYLCPPGSCTTEWDCEMNQDPFACSVYMCDNPTGQACRGTCDCC